MFVPDPIRRRLDRVLLRLYAGGWPSRLAAAVGFQRRIRLVTEQVASFASATGEKGPRFAFASDFHAGPMTHRRIVQRACRLLAEARPDVLLLGGDYVSFTARFIDRVAGPLGEVPAPHGRFAVLGNHDHEAGAAAVTRGLERRGIRVLDNACQRLPEPFDHVWICGMDDSEEGNPDPEATFEGAEGTRVLIVHSPDALRTVGHRRFDLAFTGHTHGGQIALPGGRPVVLPRGSLCRDFPHGRFDLPTGGTLIVSRGVGQSGLPVRLNAPSDVVVCELVPRPEHPPPAATGTTAAESSPTQ